MIVTVEVPDKNIWSAVGSAAEGISGWGRVEREGRNIFIVELEPHRSAIPKRTLLTGELAKKAMPLMARAEPARFAALIDPRGMGIDSVVGDAVVQFMLFGERKYA